MGGRGSGNWWRWDSRSTTDESLYLDIRWLKKQGYLRPGAAGPLTWSRRGKQTGYINYKMGLNRVFLNYCCRAHGNEEEVEQIISLDQTPCNYGGFRTWFLCPQCGKRVAVLYGAGKYFLCRHCYNLTYASQQEDEATRLIRKARKIRERLGASDDLMEPILLKPKNMHWATFHRLRREAEQAGSLGRIVAAQRFGLEIF